MKISVNSIFFFFIIIFLISPISTTTATTTTHCSSSHGSPQIKLPFDFNLSCSSSSNTTRIHFQSYDNLAVKSIAYDQRRLDLVDLDGCVHAAFLELNLSVTPFRYYYVVEDYSYLNCTTRLSSSTPIPCLSRPEGNRYVYVVKAALVGTEVPRFCKEVKRVKIPFEYSPYLDDGSFGLALTWGFDEQSKTEHKTECFFKTPNYQVVSISLVVAMVAILSMVMMKIYHSKQQKYQKEEAEKKVFNEHSYEALKTGSDEPLV